MAPTRTAKTKTKDLSAITSSTKPATPISWPALPTPAQRSHPLELEELVASQIVLLHGFFPSKICSTWTNFLSQPTNLNLEATPPAKKGEAQRTNHRLSIRDEAFAEALWRETGLAEVIGSNQKGMFESSECLKGKPIGLNPNIRNFPLTTRLQIYRYETGQSFAPHYDDTVKVGANNTEWTLLIYLSGSDEVTGGETAFYPCGVAPVNNGKARKTKVKSGEEDVVVELQRGLALLHRHGRECLLHEGKPVLQGTKWVLRSDIVVGRI